MREVSRWIVMLPAPAAPEHERDRYSAHLSAGFPGHSFLVLGPGEGPETDEPLAIPVMGHSTGTDEICMCRRPPPDLVHAINTRLAELVDAGRPLN